MASPAVSSRGRLVSWMTGTWRAFPESQIPRGPRERWRGATAMAAFALLPEAHRDAPQTPQWKLERLPRTCPIRHRGAIDGNIRMSINRGRGYTNMRCLVFKAQCMAVTPGKPRRMPLVTNSRGEPDFLSWGVDSGVRRSIQEQRNPDEIHVIDLHGRGRP
jgi:hypothetical protein